MKRFNCLILFILVSLFLVSSVSAATLTGTIYDLNLDTVDDVIIAINTEPQQRYLANSTYSFDIPEGKYILVAKKGNLMTKEEIKISGSGTYVFDLFLFPSFDDEDEILSSVGGLSVNGEKKGFSKYPWWSYAIALGIFVFLIIRVIKARKKYGPLRKKKGKQEEKQVEDIPKEEVKAEEKPKEQKEETNKESTEEKEESDQVEKTLEIIKKNDGRITQKDLRKEMMHLSEAKISLIITELEHKGKVEKIKKGRGNVVILK